jgi:hypothetical protein
MTRNNADFDLGRFHVPYEGQLLFHGSPSKFEEGSLIEAKNSEELRGVNVPVAWATTSQKDAEAQGGYSGEESSVYQVEPINPKETHGITSGRIYPGEKGLNHHFISKHGFKVVKQVK